MTLPRTATSDGAPAHAAHSNGMSVPPRFAPRVAALIDVNACAPPRLRAIAARLAGRPAGIIGTADEARRAASFGVNVSSSFLPPLGAMVLSGSALNRAFGRLPSDGSLLTVGLRAHEAARLLGAPPAFGTRAAVLDDTLPDPIDSLPRDELRASWGVAADERVCILLASPAASCDARMALDIAGRTSMLGHPVVLVVHPSSPGAARAERLASAAGGAWRLAFDARVDDPELLASAADVAIAIDLRIGRGGPGESGRSAGVSAIALAFARGITAMIPDGDSWGARLAARAGIPVVVARNTPAASIEGMFPAERIFDPRRPNVAAVAIHTIVSAASR